MRYFTDGLIQELHSFTDNDEVDMLRCLWWNFFLITKIVTTSEWWVVVWSVCRNTRREFMLNVSEENISYESSMQGHTSTFSGLADDYPFRHVSLSESAIHGHWLLIYLIPAPSSRAPINIQGLEAREGDRGQVIWEEAEREGERKESEGRAERGDLFVLPVALLATHGETNAHGKLQGSPLWLQSMSIDFVMIFISLQYFHAVDLSETILVYEGTHRLLASEHRAMKGWYWKAYFLFCFQTVTQWFVVWLRASAALTVTSLLMPVGFFL